MAEISLIKGAGGMLYPLGADDAELVASKIRTGEVIRCEFSKVRNGKFHRKYFALLNLGFEYFQPAAVQYRGQTLVPDKNFDEFRRWIAVKAGFFDIVGYPDGSIRVRAKSISFAKMDDVEFSGLYSATIDVLLASVLACFDDADAVDAAVSQIIGFC